MAEVSTNEKNMPLLDHLVELRSRLIYSVLSFFLVFFLAFSFAEEIFAFLVQPLATQMEQRSGARMIFTALHEAFFTYIKVSFFTAAFLSFPLIATQIWLFVAPGLYRNEKRLVAPLLLSSTLLFYAGMAFAYFVVFPLVFGFFTRVAPEGVTVMTDISKYLDFVTTLFLAFGMTFEVPIATIILVATGMTTVEKLSKMRGYGLVGAFALGMMLTPPDVISQTLLAVPMWLLFEVGLLMCRILLPTQARD